MVPDPFAFRRKAIALVKVIEFFRGAVHGIGEGYWYPVA
jgi:hypothetical protein